MKIEFPDDIAQKCDLSERELKELLAVSVYKLKGIHGAMAGKILGISEFEFHGLLEKYGSYVNYDTEAFQQDVQTLASLDDKDFNKD